MVAILLRHSPAAWAVTSMLALAHWLALLALLALTWRIDAKACVIVWRQHTLATVAVSTEVAIVAIWRWRYPPVPASTAMLSLRRYAELVEHLTVVVVVWGRHSSAIAPVVELAATRR